MAAPHSDANYVRARAGLLDALEALGPLRNAAVLVGAQAVYEYTRDLDDEFAVSPFTLDADLAFLPELLANDPKIPDAMKSAGFELSSQPGIYRRADGTQVDLLVPEIVSGRRGRRGADLGVHGIRAARQVRGLEGALVSQTTKPIAALADGDERAFDILVAGPAALLVAKVHKIADRSEVPGNPRLQDKDAFDIYRLLRCLEGPELASETIHLLENELAQEVTEQALELFRELFGETTATGAEMVVRYVQGLEDPDFMAVSVVELAREFLNAVDERS